MAKKYTRYTLTIIGGGKIIVDIPDAENDKVVEELQQHLSSGTVWWVGNHLNVKVDYLGEHLDFINMKLVVGML